MADDLTREHESALLGCALLGGAQTARTLLGIRRQCVAATGTGSGRPATRAASPSEYGWSPHRVVRVDGADSC